MCFPYNENRCKTPCPFVGSEPKADENGIIYIECLRDKEDASEHFYMLEGKDDLWQRQEVDFQHCIYDTENGARMAVVVQR
jgi:hypothetical protein